jgi:hypothetical protein
MTASTRGRCRPILRPGNLTNGWKEFAADNLFMDVEGHIKPYADFV